MNPLTKENLVPMALVIVGVVLTSVFSLWEIPVRIGGTDISPILPIVGSVIAALGGWRKSSSTVKDGVLYLD